MINDIGATEGQRKDEKYLGKGMHKSSYPRHSHEDCTHLSVHDAGLVQGLADGYIAVIGHHCQQENLSTTKEVHKEKLCHAAPYRYGFLFS